MNGPAARREPRFGELLRASLRVCAFAALSAALAFGLWQALRWCFPDVAWLRGA